MSIISALDIHIYEEVASNINIEYKYQIDWWLECVLFQSCFLFLTATANVLTYVIPKVQNFCREKFDKLTTIHQLSHHQTLWYTVYENFSESHFMKRAFLPFIKYMWQLMCVQLLTMDNNIIIITNHLVISNMPYCPNMPEPCAPENSSMSDKPRKQATVMICLCNVLNG